MSIGVLLAIFAAVSILVVWHWIAATKQVSEELLKEYERLLSDSREAEAQAEKEEEDAS